MDARRALVRRPSPHLADGLVTHIDRLPVDARLARQQWEGYVAALHEAGWETIEVPPADDCPDSVFVEDTVVMYADRAVITRPGADERKPEIAGTASVLRDLGYDVVSIEAPGTLDGGDVLKHGGTAWVTTGGRTNHAGVEQLAAYLGPYGARVVDVPVSKVLHLKSAVTALPDGTVLIGPPSAPGLVDASVFPVVRTVPEESGCHVVPLGGDRVLLAASAPATAGLLAGLGLTPVVVDIGEFEKLEGCVTCLSVRLRRPGREVPQP
jgi:dimethylargininase